MILPGFLQWIVKMTDSIQLLDRLATVVGPLERDRKEAAKFLETIGLHASYRTSPSVGTVEIRYKGKVYRGLDAIKRFVKEVRDAGLTSYLSSIAKSERTKQPEHEENRITIETTRFPPQNPCDAQYTNIRSLASIVHFSPQMNYQGDNLPLVRLNTTYFLPETPYWSQWVVGADGIAISKMSNFARLTEPFHSYSPKRLAQWIKIAVSRHRESLIRIEELFWDGKEFPKDFF